MACSKCRADKEPIFSIGKDRGANAEKRFSPKFADPVARPRESPVMNLVTPPPFGSLRAAVTGTSERNQPSKNFRAPSLSNIRGLASQSNEKKQNQRRGRTEMCDWRAELQETYSVRRQRLKAQVPSTPNEVIPCLLCEC
jgi:hypothetical protein